MPKNNYMMHRMAETQAILDIGVSVGFQQAMDFVSICLHDPDVAGTDTWGPERQRRLIEAVQQRDKHYSEAFGKGPEADVYREHLDRELRDCWKEHMEPFDVRYPWLNKISYKPKRG